MNYPDRPWKPCDWPPLGPSYHEVEPVSFRESGWPETLMMVALMILAALFCIGIYLIRHR